MILKKIAIALLVISWANLLSAQSEFIGNSVQDAKSQNQLLTTSQLDPITQSVVFCNGESKAIAVPFSQENLISTTPSEGVVSVENNSVILQPTENTTYTFTYVENNATKQLIVNVELEYVSADFSIEPPMGTAPFTISLLNESKNGVEYKWELGNKISFEESPTFLLSEPGNEQARLTVKGKLGCEAVSAKKSVEVYEEGEFFIPNAFTPNFDGRNETFFVIPKNIKNFDCLVYNQHGDLITTLTSKDESWDGNFNGYPAPSGRYIYKIQYTNLANQTKKLVGAVELRR